MHTLRSYGKPGDAPRMVEVRRRSLERDGLDADSVVERMPAAEEIAATNDEENTIVAECDGTVVGYAAVSWWRERDGTWLYLHRGHLLPQHRGRGIGTDMLDWAEKRIRGLVEQQGTRGTAVFGANAAATEREATELLGNNGYKRVFSLVELEMADLAKLESVPPKGIRLGAIEQSGYRAAWRTVVDSYTGADATPDWTFESFRATADPTCWRAAYEGDDMVGVVLGKQRANGVGEVEELSVRTTHRRKGIGRAVLLDGIRCLKEHGANKVRLYTGTANPHRSYALYESVGFRRLNEYVRYRKPVG
jgi:GNAT superfamily N-acetyltransferase